MVLGSAQYKRQDNLEEEMVPSGGMGGGGGGSDGSGGLEDDLGSLNSDNLREAGSLGGGGHVRFVDSTIRYHMR